MSLFPTRYPERKVRFMKSFFDPGIFFFHSPVRKAIFGCPQVHGVMLSFLRQFFLRRPELALYGHRGRAGLWRGLEIFCLNLIQHFVCFLIHTFAMPAHRICKTLCSQGCVFRQKSICPHASVSRKTMQNVLLPFRANLVRRQSPRSLHPPPCAARAHLHERVSLLLPQDRDTLSKRRIGTTGTPTHAPVSTWTFP